MVGYCGRIALKMVLLVRLCSWRDCRLRWTKDTKKQSCRFCCRQLCSLPRITIWYCLHYDHCHRCCLHYQVLSTLGSFSYYTESLKWQQSIVAIENKQFT